MDGLMDGWMDGLDEWMDGWIVDGWMDGRMDGRYQLQYIRLKNADIITLHGFSFMACHGNLLFLNKLPHSIS